MDRDFQGAHAGGYDGGFRRQAGKSVYPVIHHEFMGTQTLERCLTSQRASDRLWVVNGTMDAPSSTTIQGRSQDGDGKVESKLYSRCMQLQ
jgi:hypothetical protein